MVTCQRLPSESYIKNKFYIPSNVSISRTHAEEWKLRPFLMNEKVGAYVEQRQCPPIIVKHAQSY